MQEPQMHRLCPIPTFLSKAGDLKYKDLNGDGVINDFDKGAIGKQTYPTPRWDGQSVVRGKGLSVSVLFQGSFNYSFSVNGTGIEPFQESIPTSTPETLDIGTLPER